MEFLSNSEVPTSELHKFPKFLIKTMGFNPQNSVIMVILPGRECNISNMHMDNANAVLMLREGVANF